MIYMTELCIKDRDTQKERFSTLTEALDHFTLINTTLVLHRGYMAGEKVLGASLHVMPDHPPEKEESLPWAMDPRATRRRLNGSSKGAEMEERVQAEEFEKVLLKRDEVGAIDLHQAQKQGRRLRKILRMGLFDKLLRQIAKKHDADEDEFVKKTNDFLDSDLPTDIV